MNKQEAIEKIKYKVYDWLNSENKSRKGLKGYTDRLTEKDIEEADELLWQFAKEVK